MSQKDIVCRYIEKDAVSPGSGDSFYNNLLYGTLLLGQTVWR